MSGLVVADWQAEFDGLLFGASTPYRVTNWDGFLDLGGVRAQYTQRARAHGGFTEPHYGGGATRTLEFDISPTPTVTFAAAVAALRSNTYPQDSVRPLWFQIPGVSLLTAGAQVTNRSIPIERAYALALAQKAAVQFYFPDPLWYDATQMLSTGLPTTGGGLNYTPGLAYPLSYGTPGNTGQVACVNPGNASVSPVITVVGPIDSQGFQVTSIEEGLTITYSGSVGAADVFTIDARTGVAALNGSPRYVTYSLMPTIPAAVAGVPGVRTFAFAALGAYSSLASLSVAFAPGYW